MRLINTDLLEIETQSLEDVGQGEIQFYSVEQIDNAPTVLTIPDNPTNGDMIKALWNLSDNDIDIGFGTVYVYTNIRVFNGQDRERLFFNKDWWNAPYKENKDANNDN